MKMTSKDYLKRALLDSQEHIRDYMELSDSIEDGEIRGLFRRYAQAHGDFASEINTMLNGMQS